MSARSPLTPDRRATAALVGLCALCLLPGGGKTPTVGGKPIDGNCVSLTRLLRCCELRSVPAACVSAVLTACPQSGPVLQQDEEVVGHGEPAARDAGAMWIIWSGTFPSRL